MLGIQDGNSENILDSQTHSSLLVTLLSLSHRRESSGSLAVNQECVCVCVGGGGAGSTWTKREKIPGMNLREESF